MRLRRALITSVGSLAIVGSVHCTGTPVSSTILSPAPIDCPIGIVRADNVPASKLVEQMRGYVPSHLPDSFGLIGAWGEGDGAEGAAIWADTNCREVFVSLQGGHPSLPDGPTVGSWTVTADEPGDCGNAVLGEAARCLNYQAHVDDGTLFVQMMGLARADGDDIVLSIPT
jgi:hypothetical protein